MKKPAILVLVLAVLSLATGPAEGAARDEVLRRIRSLAENVLGQGTVKSLSLTQEGATVLMRWQSATYRPANKLAETRELLYAEAELATGAILGRLPEISRVRFVILDKDQAMASGENIRGKGVTMTFVAALGGGTMTPKEPKPTPTRSGGTSAAKD